MVGGRVVWLGVVCFFEVEGGVFFWWNDHIASRKMGGGANLAGRIYLNMRMKNLPDRCRGMSFAKRYFLRVNMQMQMKI